MTWSANKRWVSRPQNLGNAAAQGIELEAKFRLDEMWKAALPVSLRTNVSFFDSNVAQVPGPNNLLPRDYLNTGSILNGTQRQDNESANPSRVRWGVRLELKL